jgi:hypothetical protein
MRFVLLHHTAVPDPHFDLMIESAPRGPLLTWRCPHDPFTVPVTPATKIQDHRPAYLTFEGDVSGNRGHVRRVREGDGDLTTAPDGTVTLSPHLRLTPTDASTWTIAPL